MTRRSTIPALYEGPDGQCSRVTLTSAGGVIGLQTSDGRLSPLTPREPRETTTVRGWGSRRNGECLAYIGALRGQYLVPVVRLSDVEG